VDYAWTGRAKLVQVRCAAKKPSHHRRFVVPACDGDTLKILRRVS